MMSKHRTAVALAVAAAAGVLGTSAGCLLYQGGTYAYFTDTTSISIRIATQGREPSPGTEHPGHHSGAGRPPTRHGQHPTTPGDDAPGHATPKPTDPKRPPTDVPPTPGTGPTNSSGQHRDHSPQAPPDAVGHVPKPTVPKSSEPAAVPQRPKPSNGADPHSGQVSHSGSAGPVRRMGAD